MDKDRKLRNYHSQLDRKREFLAEIKLERGCENPKCKWQGEFEPEMLDYDHIDPSTKAQGGIGRVMRSAGWDALREEVGKCQVLCSNCHRHKTLTEDDHANTVRI